MIRYRAVVIGLGRIGFTLEGEYGRAKPCTHAGAYQRSRRVNLVGGYDVNLEQIHSFKKIYPKCLVNRKNEKLKEFLIRTKPNLVSVSCSSDQHLKVLRELISAYKKGLPLKGILVEKPLGMNFEEACKIKKMLAKCNLKVVVCHDRRFMTEYQEFYRMHLLRKKYGLGELRHIRGAIHCASVVSGRKGQERVFGGPMLHDGTHLIDLMLFLVGKPRLVSAWSVRRNKSNSSEDTSYGNLWFDKGVTGLFLVGGQRKYFHFELEMEWERAKLLFSHGHWLYFRQKPGTPYLQAQNFDPPKTQNPYMLRLNHLLDLIGNSNKVNLSSIEDGMVACQVIDCIYESSMQGGLAISPNNLTRFENEDLL